MGIKENLKRYNQERKKSRSESIAFKKIVAKQNLQARRKAYAEESLIQAKKEGKQLTYKKSTGRIIGDIAVGFAKGTAKRLSQPAKPMRRSTPAKQSKAFDPFNQTFQSSY